MDKLTSRNCSIGIVTYLGRFAEYFQPLIRRLQSIFPDYDLNVFLNGHYDQAKQIQYLREATAFLRSYPAVRYVTNWEHQPLARGWNWLVLMARGEQVLILNDDVDFTWEFRHHLEHLRGLPGIFTLNGSFSHFVISKEIIRQVGWFDERFLGIGWEDTDYICRLAGQGIPLGDIAIPGLANYVAPQKECAWAPQSGTASGKYAQMNLELFLKKWHHSDYGPVPEEGSFKVDYFGYQWSAALIEGTEAMPQFYPLDCLGQSSGHLAGFGARLCGRGARALSWLESWYWRVRLAAQAGLRQFLGTRRWDKLRQVLGR